MHMGGCWPWDCIRIMLWVGDTCAKVAPHPYSNEPVHTISASNIQYSVANKNLLPCLITYVLRANFHLVQVVPHTAKSLCTRFSIQWRTTSCFDNICRVYVVTTSSDEHPPHAEDGSSLPVNKGDRLSRSVERKSWWFDGCRWGV